MTDCELFKKRLNDFLEGDLTQDIIYYMEEHIKNCDACREMYREESHIQETFRETFQGEGTELKNSSQRILGSIDKKRYGKNPVKRLYFNLRRNTLSYGVCFSLVLLLALISPYLLNMYKGTGEKPVTQNVGISNNNQTQNTATLTEPVDEALPLPKAINNKEALQIVDNIKDGLPWYITYTGDKKLMFYNEYCFLAYNLNTDGSGNYYGAIDLEKIRCNYMSGEVITMFAPSPDGNSVVISNNDFNGGGSLVHSNLDIYLYNFKNGSIKTFKDKLQGKLANSWSPNSRYYAFADFAGGSVSVYDAAGDKIDDILFNGGIKDVFTSDNGDILVLSDRIYLLKKDKSYALEEVNIPGDILGLSSSGEIEYYDKGTIYSMTDGKSIPVNSIGSSYKFANGYTVIGARDKYPIVFTDGTSTIVYTSGIKNGTKFNFGYNLTDNPRFSPDFTKCLLTDFEKARVVTSEGKSLELKGGSQPFMNDYWWFDAKSLVRVIPGVETKEPGDYMISKTTLP